MFSSILSVSAEPATSTLGRNLFSGRLGVPKINLLYSRPRKLLCSCGGFQNQFAKLKKAEEIKISVTASFRSHTSCKATGSNASEEDMDEQFDDLLNKYGKVVLRRGDQKPGIADVDDDAESLAFAVAMAKVASDVKAGDIRVLFVKPLVYWTRFFIIVTAFSRPQIDAIRFKMGDLAEEKFGKVASGDTKPNSWTLMDFGDVVVHIFLPEQREYYNLEDFYGNATSIELPFDELRQP